MNVCDSPDGSGGSKNNPKGSSSASSSPVHSKGKSHSKLSYLYSDL